MKSGVDGLHLQRLPIFFARELGKDARNSIDVPAIRDAAARILEGGKQAFLQRQEKYGGC